MKTVSKRYQHEKIPHAAIVRAPGLLPMLYRPSEIAVELGVPAHMVRRWVGVGVPHERDGRGHIWINGRQLADWVETQRQSRRGPELGPDEGYCMRCRRAVSISQPLRRANGRARVLSGACPLCGAAVNRGVADDR